MYDKHRVGLCSLPVFVEPTKGNKLFRVLLPAELVVVLHILLILLFC
jgi:hypothetical protein